VIPSFLPAGIRAGRLFCALARLRQLLIRFGGKRRRGCVAKGGVRSLQVVVLDSGSDLDPYVGKANEQGLVEQFVAHSTVEALDVAVLHRLAQSDLVPLHADLAAPCEHCIAGELGAIVADDHARLAALGDQLAQLAHNTVPRD
jgi:hypothetical protein